MVAGTSQVVLFLSSETITISGLVLRYLKDPPPPVVIDLNFSHQRASRLALRRYDEKVWDFSRTFWHGPPTFGHWNRGEYSYLNL